MREMYKMRKLHFTLLLGGGGVRFGASDVHLTYNYHKYKVPYGGYYGGWENKLWSQANLSFSPAPATYFLT